MLRVDRVCHRFHRPHAASTGIEEEAKTRLPCDSPTTVTTSAPHRKNARMLALPFASVFSIRMSPSILPALKMLRCLQNTNMFTPAMITERNTRTQPHIFSDGDFLDIYHAQTFLWNSHKNCVDVTGKCFLMHNRSNPNEYVLIIRDVLPIVVSFIYRVCRYSMVNVYYFI